MGVNGYVPDTTFLRQEDAVDSVVDAAHLVVRCDTRVASCAPVCGYTRTTPSGRAQCAIIDVANRWCPPADDTVAGAL
jgi:hypothetical protein